MEGVGPQLCGVGSEGSEAAKFAAAKRRYTSLLGKAVGEAEAGLSPEELEELQQLVMVDMWDSMSPDDRSTDLQLLKALRKAGYVSVRRSSAVEGSPHQEPPSLHNSGANARLMCSPRVRASGGSAGQCAEELSSKVAVAGSDAPKAAELAAAGARLASSIDRGEAELKPCVGEELQELGQLRKREPEETLSVQDSEAASLRHDSPGDAGYASDSSGSSGSDSSGSSAGGSPYQEVSPRDLSVEEGQTLSDVLDHVYQTFREVQQLGVALVSKLAAKLNTEKALFF